MTDNKEQLIALLVNKGLDGDMDAVNACDDRMIRAKAKAMIVKVNKGTVERPPMPVSTIPNNVLDTSKEEIPSVEVNKIINPKVRDMIEEKFPGTTIDNENAIQLHPERWF